MSGWIKLHRKILNNSVVNKDPEHLAIWIYLLLNATHTSYKCSFGGGFVELKAGQLVTGRKQIATCINISESKVQRVLKTFEIEQLIEQQTSSKNRLITILNWNLYQDSEQLIEQQLNNKRTTTEQQLNTYNNVNNVNKENNVNKLVNETDRLTDVKIENDIDYILLIYPKVANEKLTRELIKKLLSKYELEEIKDAVALYNSEVLNGTRDKECTKLSSNFFEESYIVYYINQAKRGI